MPIWGTIVEVLLCIGCLYIIAKDIKSIASGENN